MILGRGVRICETGHLWLAVEVCMRGRFVYLGILM